jgi:transposase
VTPIICGVDVSSTFLDARIGGETAAKQFARDAEGIAALAAFCRSQNVELVAMETTGGYEKLPHALLWMHGVPAAILNPRAVRRFAEAMGFLEKTDRIDAGVIAWFAAVKRIVPQPPAAAAQERLRALVTRLRQLTDLRASQMNQRRLITEPAVLGAIDELISLLARQIRQFERAVAELIDSDPLWRELDKTFRSIKGVASRTVARVLAELPEIGTLPNKAITKLNGVAPLARDSGKSKGKRPVRGGRSGVRSILFVVADVVRRHDPDFAAFHKRLSDAGKPKKVIRIALARKLLVRLNAKARDSEPTSHMPLDKPDSRSPRPSPP